MFDTIRMGGFIGLAAAVLFARQSLSQQDPAPPVTNPYMTGDIMGHNPDHSFQWAYPTNARKPDVAFGGPYAPPQQLVKGIYLGYDSRGAWAYDPFDKHVYVWDGKELRPGATDLDSIPRVSLAKLEDLTPLGWYAIQRQHVSNSHDAELHVQPPSSAPEPDPNLPPPFADIRLFMWGYADGSTIPTLTLSGNPAWYLGFNDAGSWVENERDKLFYVFSPARSTAMKRLEDVPADLLNPSARLKALLNGRTQTQAAARAEAVVRAGPLDPLSGAQAKIEKTAAGATLTYVDASGASHSYAVVRPKFAQQAMAGNDTGGWMYVTPDNKSGTMFNVTASGGVSGKPMNPMMLQMMQN